MSLYGKGQLPRRRIRTSLLVTAAVVVTVWLYLRDFSLYSFSFTLLSRMYAYSATFLLVSTMVIIFLRSMEKVENVQLEGFRRMLSVGLGLFWCIAGILQLQPQMAFGFGHFVIAQSSQSLPGSLPTAMTPLVVFWASHEILLNAAAGSFQLFLGISLLSLRSKLYANVVSALSFAWAVGLWTFGEGMGGIFQAGASLLSGSPGSALIYAIISVIIMLPSDKIAKRSSVAVMSAIFLVFAVVQALPLEGYWDPFAISAITSGLTVNPQPRILVKLLAGSAQILKITAINWNAALIAIMSVTGVLWSTRQRLAAYLTLIFSLLVWVLWQDFGIFGFYSTDLNTAPSLALVSVTILLASRRNSNAEDKTRQLTNGSA